MKMKRYRDVQQSKMSRRSVESAALNTDVESFQLQTAREVTGWRSQEVAVLKAPRRLRPGRLHSSKSFSVA